MTIEVEEPKTASDHAVVLAAELGGYVAASSFDKVGSSSNAVLRIPQENFSLAMRKLAMLGKIKAESISSNDVTEQYVNLRAELDAYKTEEATLIRILYSSSTVRDALATQDAIQQVQARINQIEGELRVMQRLVAFATINVEFVPPVAAPTLDVGDVVRSAIVSFYIVLKGIMIVGGALLPIAMLGANAYYPSDVFPQEKKDRQRRKLLAKHDDETAKIQKRLFLVDIILLVTFIIGIGSTVLASVSFLAWNGPGYGPVQPPVPYVQTETTTVTASSSFSSTQQGLQPPALVLAYSLQQAYGSVAVLSWAVFFGVLIWRGHVRSVWGRSRFSYDTFRLLVRMRGAQTRLRLMHTLSEPKNKLQLAKALGIDWKAVDKHVQMLERNGIIHPASTSGTATFSELTEKGIRLLKALEEIGVDIGQLGQLA